MIWLLDTLSVLGVGEDGRMGRVGTGLTAATLPLVVALAFAQAGEVVPAVLAGVVTACLIIATFVFYLPGLHRLPFVGAPRLTAGFTANGSPDLQVRIPKQPDHGEAVTHSILVQVGINNHGRADVEQALLNFCALAGHALQICDHRGEPVDKGTPMPSTNEAPPFDYWAINPLTITGRNGYLAHFRLRVQHPGDIPLVLRIQSRDLYEELEVFGCIEVVELEGDPTPAENVSALIEEGERFLSEMPTMTSDEEVRDRAMAFDFEARSALNELDRPDLVRRLDNALLDHRSEDRPAILPRPDRRGRAGPLRHPAPARLGCGEHRGIGRRADTEGQ